ncbi:LLM class F420-dependent oxidoreductase [Kitasatospora sp. NPDC006697]|uniref:LLM class F420-dependent oxidoreductase n=1 Tax=Kitasatospora sp. NPDC006697 TaxID=3364020 RepID=UPI00369AE2A5
MRVGLHALGIGDGARPEVIRAVAAAAEAHGFDRLWCGEHVVLVDAPASHYPYSPDGRIAVPPDTDWLDPLLALSFAAAVTSRIELATGVLLLPEHNPVVVAKQAATLDVLSAGRFSLGIGVGWSAEEFTALGVPFDGRGRRTDEYLAAMRALWSDDPASFTGEFTRFDAIRVNPKPLRGGHLPVLVGGNSATALRRAAALADGWYGFNVPMADVPAHVAVLAEECARHGRAIDGLTIAVAPRDATPEHLAELAAASVTELVVVAAPPPTPEEATAWVGELARTWLRTAG